MIAFEFIQLLRILESLKEEQITTTLIAYHCTEINYAIFAPIFTSATVSGYTSSIMKMSRSSLK